MVDIVIRMKEKSHENSIKTFKNVIALFKNSDIADRLTGFMIEHPGPVMEKLRRKDYINWTDEEKEQIEEEWLKWESEGFPEILKLPWEVDE